MLPAPQSEKKGRHTQRGVALITILSIIAVVSVLVVGFTIMARMDRAASGSYSRGVVSEQLAMGGLENIILDLRSEMAAGSYVASSSTNVTDNQVRYFEPYRDLNDVALGITPRRIGYSTAVRTAIRRSVGYGDEVKYLTNYPGLFSSTNGGNVYYVTNRDVRLPERIEYNAYTTNASRNYRTVSMERWAKSRLVNRYDASEWKEFTNSSPSWVYVTRGGVLRRVDNRADLSDNRNTNYVIGRYAYIVYDVGGLIDMTVAGHATNAALKDLDYQVSTSGTNNDPANASWSKKGIIQSADLTQLRIITKDGESQINSKILNDLLLWRDTNSVKTLTNYVSSLFGVTNYGGTNISLPGTNQSMISSGFMKAMAGNNTFISRQDLIRYCEEKGIDQFLPLFTTFSREKNAPTWVPRSVNPEDPTEKYGSNNNSYTWKDNPTNTYTNASTATYPGYPNYVNTNLAGVRYTNNPGGFRTVQGTNVLVYTNYNRTDPNTGIIYTKSPSPVRAGSPVLRKRFPLSRIAWLTITNYSQGPDSKLTNAIHQAFGLIWTNGSDPQYANTVSADAYGMSHWIYTSPDSDTITNRIKTLSELATNSSTVKRDPDFFETLKAAILDGSLGVVESYTIANATKNLTISNMSLSQYSSNMSQFDMYDMYRNPDLQIIKIGANIIDQADEDSFSTAIKLQNSIPSTPTNTTVYGVESLPYFSQMLGYNGTMETNAGVWSSWVTFQVWDVHQNASVPATMTNATNVPMYFRIYAAKGRVATRMSWTPWSTNTNLFTNVSGNFVPVAYPMFVTNTGAGGITNRVVAQRTWSPADDVIYFDRSSNNSYMFGSNYSYVRASKSTPTSMDDFYSNKCAFDLPVLLVQNNANTRPMKNNGSSSNYDNYDRHFTRKYVYSENDAGSMYTLYTTNNASSAKQFWRLQVDRWTWTWFDVRPGVVGFNTGLYTNSSRSGTPLANFGRHYALSNASSLYTGEDFRDGKVLSVFGGLDDGGTEKATFVLQASASASGPWRTYQVLDNFYGTWGYWANPNSKGMGAFGQDYFMGQNMAYKQTNGVDVMYVPPETYMAPNCQGVVFAPDPRTLRLGIHHARQNDPPYRDSGSSPQNSWTLMENSTNFNDLKAHTGTYAVGKGFFIIPPTGGSNTGLITSWGAYAGSNSSGAASFYSMFNTPKTPLSVSGNSYTMNQFVGYADRDGIIRAGDAYLGQYSGYSTRSTVNPAESYSKNGYRQLKIQDRPIVMNRYYRSVGELGHVHRDMPWKTLDFFTTNSADAGLLDAFSAYEYPTDVVAGKVSLNTPYPSIIAAILSGAIKSEKGWTFTNNILNGTNWSEVGTTPYTAHPNSTNTLVSNSGTRNIALEMATNIVYKHGMTNTATNLWKPYANISQFITAASTNVSYPTPSSVNTNSSSIINYNDPLLSPIKTVREAYIRALSDTTQTRTWNLMIDIVAQSGRLSDNSTDTKDDLDDFVVEGERRYWLHIAIDRYTGEVIDQRLEPVYE